jgi:hypothetical protein
MPNDKPLKIFSKSGKRLKDEEKRMNEMNKSMEEAARDYLSGFPRGFMRDVSGVFDSDERLVNKAAKAKLKEDRRKIRKRMYGD